MKPAAFSINRIMFNRKHGRRDSGKTALASESALLERYERYAGCCLFPR